MNENAKAWVAALRSGKYEQGTGALAVYRRDSSRPTGYCCLGVACVLTEQAGVTKRDLGGDTWEGKAGDLPESARKWLGLNDIGGGYRRHGKESWLARDNDRGKTFAEIADIIESEPTGLFEEAR